MDRQHLRYACVDYLGRTEAFIASLGGITPPAVAPVPAAGEAGAKADGGGEAGLGLRPTMRPMKLVEGISATRANHGVAQTLRMRRAGRSAFTMAHAVATLALNTPLAYKRRSLRSVHVLAYDF